MSQKLWGGRFDGATHSEVEAFTNSLKLDERLWQCDLKASLAHVRMLTQVKVLSQSEGDTLEKGLLELEEALTHGQIVFNPKAEDVHSEIERLLTERVGALAGKIHTARSRNDQVATATRMYLREEITNLRRELRLLQTSLVSFAESHLETLLPGTTHLQPAQPVSLAHHLMAYFWMFQRDSERLKECQLRTNCLPLGSGALAGTSFPIDRVMVQQELQFTSICENSLDAVSDRDFVVEFLNAATLIQVHLSRMAEELILWSTPQYGFVELSDATTTGSSMMPQKKNPDVAELIRGRSGRLAGAWVGAVTMLKGLPLSYNRDLQEDKVHLFDGVDTTRSCVRLMNLMLSQITFFPEKMAEAVRGDFSNATDLADYLVTKGMPFRQAHELVGAIVRECLNKQIPLEAMSLDQMRAFSPLIEASVFNALPPLSVLKARTSRGGTSPSAVQFQIQKAKELL